jgi:hypothetical protein
LNPNDWRPITFQGVTFPPTLMAASVLEPVLEIEDEEIGAWLWRLTTCRGVTKGSPAEICSRCAQRILDLMLEQRERVLDGIREHLSPLGFVAEETYRDWILAFQQIVMLSNAANGDCTWSAPSHPDDRVKSAADAERFLRILDNMTDFEE